MSYCEPNNGGTVEDTICFDFPLDLKAAKEGAMANLDPRDYDMDIAAWSTKPHGSPEKDQGVPVLLEVEAEGGEDVQPDLIMDQSKVSGTDADKFKVYFTARLTGSFVQQLLSGNNECEIKANLVPLVTPGLAKPLKMINVGAADSNPPLVLNNVDADDTNKWGWVTDPEGNEQYICTLEFQHAANELEADEIYRVVIRWNFWLNLSDGTRVLQKWGGFDDAVHFTVRGVVG